MALTRHSLADAISDGEAECTTGQEENRYIGLQIPLSFWRSVVTNDCKYVQCGSKDQDNSKQRGPHRTPPCPITQFENSSSNEAKIRDPP
jgi:hypothetical protein